MRFFILTFNKNNSYYANYITNTQIDEDMVKGLRNVANQFDINCPKASA